MYCICSRQSQALQLLQLPHASPLNSYPVALHHRSTSRHINAWFLVLGTVLCTLDASGLQSLQDSRLLFPHSTGHRTAVVQHSNEAYSHPSLFQEASPRRRWNQRLLRRLCGPFYRSIRLSPKVAFNTESACRHFPGTTALSSHHSASVCRQHHWLVKQTLNQPNAFAIPKRTTS